MANHIYIKCDSASVLAKEAVLALTSADSNLCKSKLFASRLQNKKSDGHPFSRHFLKGTLLSEGNYMLKYSEQEAYF